MKPTTTRLALLAVLALSVLPAHAQSPLRFFPVTPCRVADTRVGGPIDAGTSRSFTVQGVCGVPTNAKAAVLDMFIVAPPNAGFLTVYPSDITRPLVSTINFNAGELALGNASNVALASTTPDVNAFVSMPAGAAHLVIDTTGFFCKVDGTGSCIP